MVQGLDLPESNPKSRKLQHHPFPNLTIFSDLTDLFCLAQKMRRGRLNHPHLPVGLGRIRRATPGTDEPLLSTAYRQSAKNEAFCGPDGFIGYPGPVID